MENYNKILNGVPCFSCQCCYSCKYWDSSVWQDWIFTNKYCPATTYTYDSIFIAFELERKKKIDNMNMLSYEVESSFKGLI